MENKFLAKVISDDISKLNVLLNELSFINNRLNNNINNFENKDIFKNELLNIEQKINNLKK